MTPNSFDLDQLLEAWRSKLTAWAVDGSLSAAARKALRLGSEPAELTTLIDQWSKGDFSAFPPIEVLEGSVLPGAAGAYAISTGTIYLNGDWLASAGKDRVIAVLTEELGHHLDGLLNAEDTPGDEGERFAGLVLIKSPSFADKKQIASEDDHRIGQLPNGSTFAFEQSATITLHEDADYRGRSKSFTIGSYAFAGNDFNDLATSISIPRDSGLVVELFENVSFQGRSTVVSFSQQSIGADWGDSNFKVSYLNDTISSLIVRPRRTDEVILYQHGNFQGLAHSEPLGEKAQVRFNDDYSSIDLPDGMGIEVFEDPSFRGRSLRFNGDVTIPGILNDRISSYRTFFLPSTYSIDRLNSDGSEGARHTFRITRSGNTSTTGSVNFTTSSDSAVSGVDFTPFTRKIDFAAGQTTRDVFVDSTTDFLTESTERFNASISKHFGADTIGNASTFGQIFDVPFASTYSIDRLNSDGSEGARHTFRITRSGSTSTTGSVNFTTSSGTAVSVVDFTPFTRKIDFAAGQTTRDVFVDSTTDFLTESTERFNASISKHFGADTIGNASTFGQIFDVPFASTYSIDRLNSDGSEGARHTFRITRSGNTSTTGSVNFTTSSDSAVSGVDFTPFTRKIDFAAGQTTRDVFVDSSTDFLTESTERFNASISKHFGVDTIGNASTFGQIFDVPFFSTYSIDRFNSDGIEGHRHIFQIRRSGNLSTIGALNFTTSSQTATSGIDFKPFTQRLIFAPGQDIRYIYVDSLRDAFNENSERFTVSITKVNTSDIIGTASTFGSIFNSPAEPPRSTRTLNTTSQVRFNDIWNTGSPRTAFSFNRFLGLAGNGFGIYDTGTNGASLPSFYTKSGEFRSPINFGFGVGGGFLASIRTGLNLSLNGSLGNADLRLVDSIEYSWTRIGDTFRLSSKYIYRPSALTVTTPSLNLGLEGRSDINAHAYLNYFTPLSPWRRENLISVVNTNPFFTRSFNSASSSESISLFGGTASIQYLGINLGITNNFQISQGVRSSVNDPLVNLSFDVDKILGSFLKLPGGLNVSKSISAGALSASASLDLADLKLNLATSIAQDLSARVDRITGSLRLEDGSVVPYRVGDTIDLPISRYDSNRDGKIDIITNLTKQGTFTNNTGLVVSANADASILFGRASGQADLGTFGSYNKTYSFGPLADPAPWRIASTNFNVFDQSWAVSLGSVNQQIQLV